MWAICAAVTLSHYNLVSDLGHRFDYNTPIEETVSGHFEACQLLNSSILLIDASTPWYCSGWLRSLHWHELLLGLAMCVDPIKAPRSMLTTCLQFKKCKIMPLRTTLLRSSACKTFTMRFIVKKSGKWCHYWKTWVLGASHGVRSHKASCPNLGRQ